MEVVKNNAATPYLNYYMTGAQLSGSPSKELTTAVFDRIHQLSDDNFHVNLIMELMPHGKINSVSPDATPYRRNLKGNALILMQWKKDSPELAQRAKGVVRELTGLLQSEGEPYGNYGRLPKVMMKRQVQLIFL